MVIVGSSWTPPENYFKGDDGTYPVTLIQIGVTDKDGNFTPDGRRTFEGGQFGPREVQDWTFALENGEIIESMVTAPRKAADGSEVISPKSIFYGYVTALAGGKKLAEGTEFDPQTHLIGRMALATIQRDDKGFPRIINLGALPTTAAAPAPAPAPATPAPATTPTPAAPAAPLREQVAPSTQPDQLPF